MERVVPQNIAIAHLLQFGRTFCIVTHCLIVKKKAPYDTIRVKKRKEYINSSKGNATWLSAYPNECRMKMRSYRRGKKSFYLYNHRFLK